MYSRTININALRSLEFACICNYIVFFHFCVDMYYIDICPNKAKSPKFYPIYNNNCYAKKRGNLKKQLYLTQ